MFLNCDMYFKAGLVFALSFPNIVSERQHFLQFVERRKTQQTVNLEVAFPTFKNANNFVGFACILILTIFNQYL